MRILVIDDNAVNLDLMLYLLRSFGHEAAGCDDPHRGFDEAVAGNYEAILSDVLMPGIDGYELARRLKDDARTADVPLIAVTALAMPADRERVAQSRFDGYIAKPIDPRTFVTQIERFVARAHG